MKAFTTVGLAVMSLGVLCVVPESAQARHRRCCRVNNCCQAQVYYQAPVDSCCGGPMQYGPAQQYQQPYGQPQQQPYGPAQQMPSAASATVTIRDGQFEPKTLNVQPGTTVRWVNSGQKPHTVTARDGRGDSADIQPGASYTATFSRPGTLNYYCRHHQGMEGTVVVGDGKNPQQ